MSSHLSGFHVLRRGRKTTQGRNERTRMNVVGVLMAHCSITVGSMNEGCAWCNQTSGRQTERGKKSLWAITPKDERTFSLGVLRSWRRVLPQLCWSCLNSMQNAKRKTQLRWPLTPQSLAVVNNSGFLVHRVMLFALRINKPHGFPGDICAPQVTVGAQGEPKARMSFLCTCREMCFVAPETRPRAVHFKPVFYIHSRETVSPCGPHRTEWMVWWFSAGSL